MSKSILNELQHRNFYFKLALIFNLLLFGFLWLNGYLIRGAELADSQSVFDYVPSLSPPKSVIDEVAADSDPAYENIKSSLIAELKKVAPSMENDAALNKFATLLGKQAAESAWPSDQQISLLSHRVFPRQENRISADYIALHLGKGDTQQKIEDISTNWKTKSRKIGINTGQYSKYGIGLAENAEKLFAVIYLAKPLLSFEQDFPTGGKVDLTATLADSSISGVRIKRTDFSRGFFKEVDQQVKEIAPSVSLADRTFQLELGAPPGDWSSVQFFIDGELSGFGRVILPNKADVANTASKSANTSTTVVPKQAKNAGRQLTASELAKFSSLLERVNQSRKNHGLSALVLDEVATKAALSHCEETVKRGYIGHWGQDGSLPFHRYHSIGGNGHVSENLAWHCKKTTVNSPTCNGTLDRSTTNLISLSARMHDLFMAETPPDDGHRKTILEPGHTAVGLAYAVKDGAFAYCEEYIGKYATINPLTATNRVGQSIELKGEVDDPRRNGIYAISISFDSTLAPFLRNPQPPVYLDSGSQEVKSLGPWDIKYNQSNGIFTAVFTPDQPGLYYVKYFVKQEPGKIPYKPVGSASYNTANATIAAAQLITVDN